MKNIDKHTNLEICMQCNKPSQNLFWINDYDGIAFKKVCSSECMNKALSNLMQASEEYNNLS